MAIDYTDWPTVEDVKSKLAAANVTLPAAFTAEYIGRVILAVAAATVKDTRRTWVVETADRYFDGNDAGELEIDEFVEINSVSVLGWFGGLNSMTLTGVHPVSRNTFPMCRIQILQGSLPSYTKMWLDRFPGGRSNIKVNADWGYAAEIPADLWEAVCGEVSARTISEYLFSTSGWPVQWKESDVMETNQLIDPKTFFTWRQEYKAAIARYKKPTGRTLRKLIQRLI